MIHNETYTCIDLAKTPWYRENQKWVGQKVTEVINPEEISKIILTEAVTNATAAVDFLNINRFLKEATVFEHNPEPYKLREEWIWEAILETSEGGHFLFRANTEWVCIVSPGGHGFIRRKEDGH